MRPYDSDRLAGNMAAHVHDSEEPHPTRRAVTCRCRQYIDLTQLPDLWPNIEHEVAPFTLRGGSSVAMHWACLKASLSGSLRCLSLSRLRNLPPSHSWVVS